MYGNADKCGLCPIIYRLVPRPSRYEIRQWPRDEAVNRLCRNMYNTDPSSVIKCLQDVENLAKGHRSHGDQFHHCQSANQ